MTGPCPYDMCDGSGFVVDGETKTARDCRCRPERIGRARARALSAVIPRRFRDEYYTKEGSEHPGEAELLIAKHRNGALGDVKLTFQAQYPRFMTYVAEDRFA